MSYSYSSSSYYTKFGCALFDCALFDCALFDCALFDCTHFDCACGGRPEELAEFSQAPRSPARWLKATCPPQELDVRACRRQAITSSAKIIL